MWQQRRELLLLDFSFSGTEVFTMQRCMLRNILNFLTFHELVVQSVYNAQFSSYHLG